MDDQFRSIDDPPEEYPAGMSAADFAADGTQAPGPPTDLGAGPPMEPEVEPPMEPPIEPGGEGAIPAGEEPRPSGQEKMKAFVSTPKGKAIAIGGAAGFLLVLGVVAFVVASVLSGPSVPTPQVTGTTGGSAPAKGDGASNGTTLTAESGGGAAEGLPEAFEIFETKDPFKPLIVAPPKDETGGSTESTATAEQSGTTTSESEEEAASSSGTSSSGSGTSSGGGSGTSSGGGSTSTNSLTLKSITYSNGEYTAVLVYGGKNYTVTAGDVVDSSPWKVLSISSNSVTMQYGDDQITLTLGSSVLPTP